MFSPLKQGANIALACHKHTILQRQDTEKSPTLHLKKPFLDSSIL